MHTTITPIQIRFSDVDKLGHVNNAIYLSYLELARMHYFQEVAGGIKWEREGIIMARIEIDYVAPVLLNEKLYVKTWCSRIGNKSFELSYTLYKKKDDADNEAARAKSIQVCFDYVAQKSIEMPALWREWLKK